MTTSSQERLVRPGPARPARHGAAHEAHARLIGESNPRGPEQRVLPRPGGADDQNQHRRARSGNAAAGAPYLADHRRRCMQAYADEIRPHAGRDAAAILEPRYAGRIVGEQRD